MGREIEIKLRVDDVEALRRALKRIGAKPVSRDALRVYERNELFDTADNALKNRGQLLRIRIEARGGGRLAADTDPDRTILTFKAPVARGKGRGIPGAGHNVREELEVQITDGTSVRRILEQLGMRIWFRYEKCRSTFRLPPSARWARQLLMELDETPIGVFMELEGPAAAIDRAARQLGYSKRDYVAANYCALYRDYCRHKGRKLGDMVFEKKRRR
jgi:adenylate cyclase, class 2